MLKNSFRNLIIQEKVGIITKQELIKSADNYILKNDDFPYWLQKISMDEDLYNEEILDLGLNPININDFQLIAQCLLDRYKTGKLDIHQIETISRSICNAVDTRCDLYYFFDWITDEVHLIKEGYKKNKDFEKELYRTLKHIIEIAKRQL